VVSTVRWPRCVKSKFDVYKPVCNPIALHYSKCHQVSTESNFRQKLILIWHFYIISCRLQIAKWRLASTDIGHVANPRPVAKMKTGHVFQPITDADDATGRNRSWNAMCPCCAQLPAEIDKSVQTKHCDRSLKTKTSFGHKEMSIAWELIPFSTLY